MTPYNIDNAMVRITNKRKSYKKFSNIFSKYIKELDFNWDKFIGLNDFTFNNITSYGVASFRFLSDEYMNRVKFCMNFNVNKKDVKICFFLIKYKEVFSNYSSKMVIHYGKCKPIVVCNNYGCGSDEYDISYDIDEELLDSLKSIVINNLSNEKDTEIIRMRLNTYNLLKNNKERIDENA